MLRNYFITAIRNLTRNAGTTVINISGLVLGVSCSIVAFLLIVFGLSYNQHHINKDKLFRIVTINIDKNGNEDTTPGIPIPLIDEVSQDISGISSQAFVAAEYEQMLAGIVQDNGETIYFQINEQIGYTERSFFSMFTRPLVSGSIEDFDEPNKIVISEKLADRYFPGEEALGQYISLNKKDQFEVVAVMKDFPVATDFPFDIFISFETYRAEFMSGGWSSVSSDDQLYLQLEEGMTAQTVNDQLVQLVNKNYNEEDRVMKTLMLQSIHDLHHDDRFGNFRYRSISKSMLLTRGAVAFFVIGTSCVNFVNLSTAIAVRRSREIGIRKVLGGRKIQLVQQFLGEIFLIVCIAIVISLGVAEFMLIHLNTMLDTSLELTYSAGTIVFLFLLLIGITLLAGLYPSFIVSGYNPVSSLKNRISLGRDGRISLRKGLVTFQFLISQVFIISTLILISQMKFIRELELGFDPEAVITMPLPDKDNLRKKSFKNEISAIKGVESASLIFTNPASGSVSITNFHIAGEAEDYNSAIKVGDENFLEVFDIPLQEGEGLTPSDTINRLVVNEEWLKEAHVKREDAVGTLVNVWGYEVPVSGVVRNFHTMSARQGLQPVMIMSGIGNTRSLAVKVDMQQYKHISGELEKTWKKFYPEYLYEYQFVDDEIREFYESDTRMSQLFTFFAFVAIGIGCLGLFGLIAYTTNRKTKEIGVRKVHGATSMQIFTLLTKDVFKLIVLAFFVSIPLVWYGMSMWLENYTYKIELSPIYAISGLFLTLIIAFFTVGYRSFKASVANPAESLRTE